MSLYRVEIKYSDVTGIKNDAKPNYRTKLRNDYLILDITGNGAFFLTKEDAKKAIRKSASAWLEDGFRKPGGKHWSNKDFLIIDDSKEIEIPAKRLEILEG